MSGSIPSPFFGGRHDLGGGGLSGETWTRCPVDRTNPPLQQWEKEAEVVAFNILSKKGHLNGSYDEVRRSVEVRKSHTLTRTLSHSLALSPANASLFASCDGLFTNCATAHRVEANRHCTRRCSVFPVESPWGSGKN